MLVAPGAFADQITMKDGDRITGDIVKKDGDAVTVKSKNFGTVTLKWNDVAAIKSDEPINVTLTGGEAVKATIQTQGDRIRVAAPGSPLNVDPNDVVTLRNDAEERSYERFLHPGLLDLWTVTGSLNIAGAKGNAETSTLTTPVNLVRASNTTRTTAYFNSIRSSATIDGVSGQTARAVRGGWSYNRKIDASRMFFNGFNDYEYDKFQALDLRVVLGGGAGYVIWSRDVNRLTVTGGGDWDRSEFGASGSDAAFTRNSTELFWGDDFNYKLSARTSVTQGFRMFNNLTNTGQYRINADLNATTQLTKWLNWNIDLSERYLTDPTGGRKKNDFLYSTGFGFTWAR